ncbi:hypothetical protein [Nonomuraea pusilla]|uniref:Alkaline shock response membrane anchor protein AmaP n=1 Tax=Nonomuraea pusilla TaxID=46177 RepID=A0A1H8ANW7_9ACTN|nr:hypothetical protein [Nonomuraea pusilla]SEM72381.1 hypothetical protein SAMN05660976_05924 [Nonomuraea pusilla]
MSDRTGRGNRWGLAVVGLVLAVLGGLTLARGLGGFSARAAGTPVVDAGVRSWFAANSPWIWWAVTAVALVVALLGLRWLFAQGRGEALGSYRIERGAAGVTDLSASGMAEAVAADVARSPAVLSADAGLAGRSGRPEVRLRVVADERWPMSELSEHLSRVALPHMRDALEADRVPAVARVSLEPSPAPQRVVR